MSELQERLRPQFEDALNVASQALEEFRKQPMQQSKRGGDRLSPWWRVWNEAVQNVVRLGRLLAVLESKTPRSLDAELANLLEQEGKSG